VSFTLRGRFETRVAAAIVPLLAAAAIAAALAKWWPVELVGLMLAVGLVADAGLYHRLLPYQPGWLALPFGLAELGLVMALAYALELHARLGVAVGLFALGWLAAQVLVHAGFPLWRVSYGEDGGELGAPAGLAAVAVLAVFAFSGGVARAHRIPVVHLSGSHGPLVIDRRERLVGDPGSVVHGGIVVRTDGVQLKNVTVVGGENGIDVENVHGVLLDGVRVVGARLDGIHVRRSVVTIRDCLVNASGPYAQGIDVSFSFDLAPSVIEGCVVQGGAEGIATHSANVMVHDNDVSGTSLRAITVTEMSMGEVSGNTVRDALGVGIFCGDHSECMIDRNGVYGTRPDVASGDRARAGFGIEAHFGATAELSDNRAGRTASFAEGRIERRG
jgi:hypothetical protein